MLNIHSYYFVCFQEIRIYESNIQSIERFKDVPLVSQMIIMSKVLYHRILNEKYEPNEFYYMFNFLLTHTMGQMFNIRLHAQYLFTIVNKYVNYHIQVEHKYLTKIIEHNLNECAEEKKYIKMQEDLFLNKFDIECMTPVGIFYYLPKICDDIVEEPVKESTVMLPPASKCVEYIKENNSKSAITEIWLFECKQENEWEKFQTVEKRVTREVKDEVGSLTIQKKYIPWKNMSDLAVYESDKQVKIIQSVEKVVHYDEMGLLKGSILTTFYSKVT